MTPDVSKSPASVSKPVRSWVWRCTDESIAAGQISVMAVTEVFTAVVLYWWLAERFEWPWITIISLVAAPILLMRSPASVEIGVVMLRRWIMRKQSDFAWWEAGWVIIISFYTSGYISNTLTQAWPPSFSGWKQVDLAAVIGIVAIVAAIAIASICATLITLSFSGRSAIHYMRTAVALSSFSGSFAGAIIGAGSAAYLVATVAVAMSVAAVLLSSLINKALPKASASVGTGFLLVFFPIFASAIAGGISIRALTIRLFATICHPALGLRELPRNWRETLWVIDIFHAPELLPQAGRVEVQFTLRGLLRAWSDSDLLARFAIAFIAPVIYLPTIAYRWSLKASAWLWWPIALVLTPTPQGYALRDQAAQISRGFQAWLLNGSLTLALAWLTPSFWPDAIPVLKELSPDLAKQAQKLLTLMPPPGRARLFLLVLAAALAIALWIASRNLLAGHDKVMGSPKDYRDLNDEERHNFDTRARRLKRIQLALIVTLIFLIELSTLALFNSRHPEVVAGKVWPWLMNLL